MREVSTYAHCTDIAYHRLFVRHTQEDATMRKMATVCCLAATFILCCPVIGGMAVDALPRQILVFGGNGMIGSATMEAMLRQSWGSDDDRVPPNDRYVLVHRGNWYWDTGFTIRPHVTHIRCDRLHKLENCPELTAYVSSTPHFDLVVDFSAYHPDSITEALDLLQGKVKLYVYISTDSVYEVCEKRHGEATREEDAVRPEDEDLKSQLKDRDHYGNYKLECEEMLASYRLTKGGPPYVSLRLPDVVGPRDNTYRWWIYQLWIKLSPYLEKPVSLPPYIASVRLSLVYVDDVADIIARLALDPPEEALDQAFNLAMKETPTVLEFLVGMRDELNLTDLEISQDEKSERIRYFPSVSLGPVNISKAEKVLDWKPTEWAVVLKKTVEFYESAIKQAYIDKQKTDVIHTMQTYFTSKPYDVIRGLKDIYGLSFAERKDEL